MVSIAEGSQGSSAARTQSRLMRCSAAILIVMVLLSSVVLLVLALWPDCCTESGYTQCTAIQDGLCAFAFLAGAFVCSRRPRRALEGPATNAMGAWVGLFSA
mmetsp:Transcript_11595/g.35944  ORF Transcript_11595/g.35944 Transcript_11595/m.35944 type:complete len:102 (+) Transcript_11595:83-388(+)